MNGFPSMRLPDCWACIPAPFASGRIRACCPSYRTQGGHRRFKQSEVLLWANTSRRQQTLDPVDVVRAAVHNIRLQISEGRLEAESWYQKLDETARTQYQAIRPCLVSGADQLSWQPMERVLPRKPIRSDMNTPRGPPLWSQYGGCGPGFFIFSGCRCFNR